MKLIIFLLTCLVFASSSFAKDLETDPEWCAGLAMMAGEDPNQAKLDCIMTRRMLNAEQNPDLYADTEKDYRQYQQDKALRNQAKQLKDINKKLDEIRTRQFMEQHGY